MSEKQRALWCIFWCALAITLIGVWVQSLPVFFIGAAVATAVPVTGVLAALARRSHHS